MYHTKVTDKTIRAGNNKLFSNDEWVPATELFGEIKVLNHPLMHEAFDRILDQHVIKQPTAFLSLCSATRPYYYSTKWKEYVNYTLSYKKSIKRNLRNCHCLMMIGIEWLDTLLVITKK